MWEYADSLKSSLKNQRTKTSALRKRLEDDRMKYETYHILALVYKDETGSLLVPPYTPAPAHGTDLHPQTIIGT